MSEYSELYQQVIIDHGRHPKNFREMPEAGIKKVGHNPLCGDKLILFLKLDGERITDISFQGEGCAISMASSSLMTEAVKGMNVNQALELFTGVHDLVTGNKNTQDQNQDENQEKLEERLGKLAVLSGVSAYPARVKCASLAWQTLKAGLEHDEAQEVKTE